MSLSDSNKWRALFLDAMEPYSGSACSLQSAAFQIPLYWILMSRDSLCFSFEATPSCGNTWGLSCAGDWTQDLTCIRHVLYHWVSTQPPNWPYYFSHCCIEVVRLGLLKVLIIGKKSLGFIMKCVFCSGLSGEGQGGQRGSPLLVLAYCQFPLKPYQTLYNFFLPLLRWDISVLSAGCCGVLLLWISFSIHLVIKIMVPFLPWTWIYLLSSLVCSAGEEVSLWEGY